MSELSKRGSWLGLLGGIGCFGVPAFFRDSFVFSYFSVCIYIVLAIAGILLLVWNISVILNIKTRNVFLLLMLGEFVLYGLYISAKKGCEFWDGHLKEAQVFHKNYLRNLAMFDADIAIYDQDLFYTLKEGSAYYNDEEFSCLFENNSVGLRNDEESLNYPEILFLGDSHTMGWGVNQSEAFPSIVEKEIGQKCLNAGIASYGTAREYLLTHRLKLDSCKLVVWQFSENDIYENRNYIENGFKLKISPKEVFKIGQIKIYRNRIYFPFKLSFEFSAQILRGIHRRIFKKKANNEISKKQSVEDFFKIVKQFQKKYNRKILIFNLESHQTTEEYFRGFEEEIVEDTSLFQIKVLRVYP